MKRYAVEVLHFFSPEEVIRAAEMGDGNLNYVTRVWSETDSRSVIITLERCFDAGEKSFIKWRKSKCYCGKNGSWWRNTAER